MQRAELGESGSHILYCSMLGVLLFHLFALSGSLMQFGMQKYVQCHIAQEGNTYHPWVNLKANTFLIKCIV